MAIEYTHPRRIPKADREQLNKEDKKIYDLIDQTRGGVWGPYSALMHVPALAERVAAVGEYLRFHGTLPGDQREFAILCAAKEGKSKFEWVVHEPVAIKENLDREAIEFLRNNEDLLAALDNQAALCPRKKLIVQTILSLFNQKSIPNNLYDQLEKHFERDEIIELFTIAGFYQMLAFIISGFDVPEPPSSSPSF